MLVAADDDGESRAARDARRRDGEGAIGVDGLVRDGDHQGAALLGEQVGGGAEGRVVGGEERGAVERDAVVHAAVLHHHADEPDPHVARRRAADVQDLRRRQARIEAEDVGREAGGAELVEAGAELCGADVVLVVAQHHVRDGHRVHAVDHAAALIQAREHAGADEVAREGGHEHVGRIDVGGVLHQRAQAREVVERIDVVDADEAERGPARGAGVRGGHGAMVAEVAAEGKPRARVPCAPSRARRQPEERAHAPLQLLH